MNIAILKLLPYSESGIVSRHSNDTLILSGFRDDVDLKTLQAELEAEYLDLARQEATNRVKAALAAANDKLRPADLVDLMAKLQLGRITPEGRQTLNEYYDKLDALEQESAALQTAIAQADSVHALNSIPWPEWVEWKSLPVRFLLLAESPKPEPPKPEPVNPDPIKPEPVQPDLPESGSAQPEPVKPDPIDLEDKT